MKLTKNKDREQNSNLQFEDYLKFNHNCCYIFQYNQGIAHGVINTSNSKKSFIANLNQLQGETILFYKSFKTVIQIINRANIKYDFI